MMCARCSEILAAVRTMFDARRALEVAPTANGKAFDGALADHEQALRQLKTLAEKSA